MTVPSYLSDDANPKLVEFMDTKLNSLVKWDLIQFFYRKPNLVGPAPKIASLTGRDLRRVEIELREMVATGLLESQKKSGVVLYSLSPDMEIRHLIEQFVHACDDRKFREAAIYHTVSKR
jgi:hypothetical protein